MPHAMTPAVTSTPITMPTQKGVSGSSGWIDRRIGRTAIESSPSAIATAARRWTATVNSAIAPAIDAEDE